LSTFLRKGSKGSQADIICAGDPGGHQVVRSSAKNAASMMTPLAEATTLGGAMPFRIVEAVP
jgi:hypothetical protein